MESSLAPFLSVVSLAAAELKKHIGYYRACFTTLPKETGLTDRFCYWFEATSKNDYPASHRPIGTIIEKNSGEHVISEIIKDSNTFTNRNWHLLFPTGAAEKSLGWDFAWILKPSLGHTHMVFVQAKNVKYTNDGVNERPNISFKYRLTFPWSVDNNPQIDTYNEWLGSLALELSNKDSLVQNGGVQVHGLYLLYGQNECQVSWATLNEAVKIQGTHANDVAGEVIRRIESRGGALNQQLLNDSIIVRE